jgi:predicted enzyme related to lactoylglutathione lyase
MVKMLVNVDVDDLQKAAVFYVDGFGLSIGRRLGAGAVELLGAGAPIYLLQNETGSKPFPGAETVRSYARHWTPVHLDFAVEHLEAAVERAEAAGARRESGITEHDWGRMALLSDPWGHGVCLLEFSASGYDAITTG